VRILEDSAIERLKKIHTHTPTSASARVYARSVPFRTKNPRRAQREWRRRCAANTAWVQLRRCAAHSRPHLCTYAAQADCRHTHLNKLTCTLPSSLSYTHTLSLLLSIPLLSSSELVERVWPLSVYIPISPSQKWVRGRNNSTAPRIPTTLE